MADLHASLKKAKVFEEICAKCLNSLWKACPKDEKEQTYYQKQALATARKNLENAVVVAGMKRAATAAVVAICGI
jgi:RNA polymerase-interacting CarD/CdnL/TRCF family regulator